MPDTVRTLSALQTLLADNTAGDISPQDVRDMLVSTYQLDYSADTSITGTATATISKWHICTGTTSDYTVTLPAASGNAGKLIGLRMSSALTKLVTIDGNGAETIDGATTRVMWANEVAVLFCDGTGWTKIAGKSIPMMCYASFSGSSAVVPNTWTVKSVDTNTDGSLLYDATNDRIKSLRPVTMVVNVRFVNDAVNTLIAGISKNGTLADYSGAGGSAWMGYTSQTPVVANDYLEPTYYAGSGNIVEAQIRVNEILTW